MCNLKQLGRISSLLLLMVTALACHHARSWQVVPNLPSIDPPKEDFTLVWDRNLDANGGPLDPYWGLEKIANQIPPREEGQPPYPCELDPFSAACSENRPIIQDLPLFPNSVICGVGNLQAKIHGHADWIVGSQRGCIQWEDQSPDGDYNFQMFPPNPNRSVLTKNNGGFIGLEFDYYETLVNAQSPFWQKFRTEVEAEDNDQRSHQPEIRKILRPAPQDPSINPRAMAVGLFGVDCEHGCKSEIHPILALAIETNDDPNDNTWMVFARNWGDQGFCSQYRHMVDFPDNKMSVLLLDDGNSHGATLIPEKTKMFASTGSGIPFPITSYWAGRGPVLTFSFPAPEKKRALVEMEVHYKWDKLAPPSCEAPTPKLTPRQSIRFSEARVQPEDAEDYVAQLQRNLRREKPAFHEEFLRAQTKAAAPLMTEVATPSVRALSTFTPPSRVPKIKPIQLPTDGNKRQRDAANIQMLCSYYSNHLPPFNGQDLSAQLCDQKKLAQAAKGK